MKKQILVENRYGHGGVNTLKSKVRRKLRRVFRPKLGMAAVPFDWAAGFHLRSKLSNIRIKDQGISSSCGGQAKSQWTAVIRALLTGQPYSEDSAKADYAPIAHAGGGTTVHELEEDLGSLPESAVPSYQDGNPGTEEFMADRSWMTSENLKAMMANAGWTAVSVSIDLESIAEAVRDYGAVIWEIEGQNNGTWLSPRPKPPVRGQGEIWAHFMCSEGAGMNGTPNREISMFQSWGTDVGYQGVQYFGQDYTGSGYIVDCFTFVRTPPKFIFSSDMKFGDMTGDVKQLQKRLGVWQSGWFGPLTFAAVILYQKTHGIQETGFCGPITRSKLNSQMV